VESTKPKVEKPILEKKETQMITPSEPLKKAESRNDNDKKNPTTGEFYYEEEEVEEEYEY
jgi:hypothetical protein